jgi:2-polyprenyl-6-methoxyphenol hydroxylase-like FAD-dependent oxidoreductase
MTRLAHTPNTAIIVGGSLVGTAIRLAHEGLSVMVLERGPRFGDDIGLGIDRRQLSRVSGVGEFHPHALAETDVRLSPHPAPIVRPRPCRRRQ